MSGTGPAQFPRDVTDTGQRGPGDEQERAKAKLKELEEARRAGKLSDEEFEDQARRLRIEERGG